MKRIILVLGICSAMALNTFAQDNAIKINPLSAAVATGNIQYEKAIGESQSFQLGLFYTGIKVTDTKFAGFGVTPEYRFYLGDKGALNSFFVAPYVRYQNFSLTEEVSSSKATLSNIGGGLILGRQWLIGESFVLDLFLGPNYSSASVKVKSGSENDLDTGVFGSGIGVRWGICLGFAF